MTKYCEGTKWQSQNMGPDDLAPVFSQVTSVKGSRAEGVRHLKRNLVHFLFSHPAFVSPKAHDLKPSMNRNQNLSAFEL